MLSRDPSAPLGNVAASAGVARSTLHRYFPDRDALVAALLAFAEDEYEAAFAQARTEDGSGLEAFRRLCIALSERLEVLLAWMHPGLAETSSELDGTADPEDGLEGPVDERVTALVARGHADGSIDPLVTAPWVEQLLWATLYAIAQAPTTTSLSAFEARTQALRTLCKAVAADPGGVPGEV